MRRPLKAALRLLMELSDVPVLGGMCRRSAAIAVGPYKDKRVLAYLTRKPYVSTRAEIKCEDFRLGRNCFIDDRVVIYCEDGGGLVHIGEKSHLYRGTNIEVGSGGRVIIGSNTHIQGPCDMKAFLRDLVIGSDVQMAPYCTIVNYNHAFDDLSRPIRIQGVVSRGDTIIEDDVWLGAGVCVLDGVRIGKGSVIGAGSVVARDIPPYSVAVGTPAVVIRKRGSQAAIIKEALKAS